MQTVICSIYDTLTITARNGTTVTLPVDFILRQMAYGEGYTCHCHGQPISAKRLGQQPLLQIITNYSPRVGEQHSFAIDANAILYTYCHPNPPGQIIRAHVIRPGVQLYGRHGMYVVQQIHHVTLLAAEVHTCILSTLPLPQEAAVCATPTIPPQPKANPPNLRITWS